MDQNLANRYPIYVEPNTYGYVPGSGRLGKLERAPVRLQKQGKVHR